ncbi:MAG: type II toxin-antitoxin system VapC family toxin [Dongiaceae bacterium]
MRLLLDTHAFLWWLDGDRRLPLRLRRLIGDDANAVYVSAATAWEIATKARLGKLPGATDVAADVGGAVASQGFLAMPVTIPHAQRAGALPGPHRDPFDRMLIAQSQMDDVPLVSVEALFDGYGVTRLWA